MDIYAHYEQDISRLLSLAASSISLLTLPQTDGPDDGLPQGGERSEQFVLEVSEYFDLLDVCYFLPSLILFLIKTIRAYILPLGHLLLTFGSPA